MKVIDLWDKSITTSTVKEVFSFNGGSWTRYFSDLKEYSIEPIDFTYEDIDRKVICIEDDGEIIHLKDGRWVQVCWRWHSCHVWDLELEDDDSRHEILDQF